jgi:aminoglycoside phosphotransferase family enzyme
MIEDQRNSEHATVFFTRQRFNRKYTLMKVLHKYEDTRYQQETVGKRQYYQLEALRRNRAFSPEIYLGLASVEEQNLRNIRIGELLQWPTHDDLEPNVEYALIMRQLPEKRNLVTLFKQQDSIAWSQHIHILTEHVAHIHRQLIATQPTEDEKQWGTYQQLEKKLLHNFGLLDLVLKTQIPGVDYDDVRQKITWLKERLYSLFEQEGYRDYFDRRVRNQCVRLCHGDLKSPNIWILPYEKRGKRDASHFVKILDAIDFNPTYCNIDILSDFAMLAIDIQVRTNDEALVKEMIDTYLRLTNQEDACARAVLDFYLSEKAFVGAAISIVYDNLPELGLNLLNIAVKRLEHMLLNQQHQVCAAVL